MIISEKQVMRLISVAWICLRKLDSEYGETIKKISSLLDEIADQQSTELKEVK